ncbi:MAG TPA: ATPase, T2SS/T4P/T4SS family [Candidatus Absconditabacterales bacterium]|nr:ATPase, T2SS/T4P/T4SS family [Candidatus Absconditabacterales bacterium]HNG96663.1 ATPase, T2SS/T4P/T4SS family [Candidatus Absconditabacterales bacterium]
MQTIQGNNSVLDQYFDHQTMSVHFKADCPLMSKKGHPGNWQTVLSKESISHSDLVHLTNQLLIQVQELPYSWLEIDRTHSKVLQIGPYRVVIVYEPLADDLEITVVKPVKKLSLSDYQLSNNVYELLTSKAKGVLISGSPGSGKSTFAQALIQTYVEHNKIVKTIESPRDLLVDKQVVQYSFSYAPHSEIRDILLLSRPDIAIYNEVRNVDDFILFKDLRLTGIGLIGVIHATAPVDSIQRFIGTIEMGIIPQVIDTVIFMNQGTITSILQLKQVVKMPSGMMSSDLSRPVIEVTDFLDRNKLTHEIYTYGEQVVVMPLDQIQSGSHKEKNIIFDSAGEQISQLMSDMFKFPVRCTVTGPGALQLRVHPSNKGMIIGSGGSTVRELEQTFGVRIDIEEDNDLERGMIARFSTGSHSSKNKHKKRR